VAKIISYLLLDKPAGTETCHYGNRQAQRPATTETGRHGDLPLRG